ncbi:hypothetical protein D3C71_2093790 [compost metagenome]
MLLRTGVLETIILKVQSAPLLNPAVRTAFTPSLPEEVRLFSLAALSVSLSPFRV